MIPFATISELIGIGYLIPSGREKTYTTVILLTAVVNVLLNIGFIFALGSIGAAVATAISEVLKNCLLLYFVRNEFSFKELFRPLIKKFIAALVMFAFIFPMSLLAGSSILQLIVIIFVGIILFFTTEWLLKDKEFAILCKYCFNFVKNLFKRKHE